MVGLLGAGLTSFALHPERDLNQATNSLGSGRLIVLRSAPFVDGLQKFV
jgi:hypothetical protein